MVPIPSSSLIKADFICNWFGNFAWTKLLEWHGKDGYNAATDIKVDSKTTGKPLGEYRSYLNFAFLRVYEAGHMVHLLPYVNS